MPDEITDLWEQAACMDPTLMVRSQEMSTWKKRQFLPQSYSRDLLFSLMMQEKVGLFKDFPVRLVGPQSGNTREKVAALIKTSFPKRQRARAQTGPSRFRYQLKVPEVMSRWERGRALVGVTDLHFRDTKIEEAIEFSALKDFDILCSRQRFIDEIETMSLVICSRGHVTDTHADDCDGSNHCFVGKKLWLAWDRIEGTARGFQDADRDMDQITDRAAFDMEKFLSLPRSCWFIVKDGQTVFLPGRLAHKVVTLEPYLGFGGYHVGLPNHLTSIRRWILYDTVEINQKSLLGGINNAILRKLDEVRRGSGSLQEHWGLSYMYESIARWEKNEAPETKEFLLKHPVFGAFLRAVRNSGRHTSS